MRHDEQHDCGHETHDDLGILLHRLAGSFFGIALAAVLCRALPSIASWLAFFGLLFGSIFTVLSQSRSKTLTRETTAGRSK